MKLKINKILILSSIIAASFLSPSSAQTGFGGIGKMLKGDKSDTSQEVSIDSFSESSAEAAEQVLTARIAFLDAQIKLNEALGLKTDGLVKASEALRAVEGAATKPGEKVAALKDSSKVTKGAKKEFDEALDKSGELSDESKAKFAEGAGRFIEGVMLEKNQIATISGLISQGKSLAASAGLSEKLKVAGMIKPVTALSLMVPGDVKEATSTLGKIMKFAKSQNITSIPNSDEATDSLGDL